jgi:hypothetical protein
MALSDAERKFMEMGRQAGYSDDELVAKVKERRASVPAPAQAAAPAQGGPRRGDELFQPEPNRSGPLVDVEGVPLDVTRPETRNVQGLSTFNHQLKSLAGGLGGGMLGGAAVKALPGVSALPNAAGVILEGAGSGAGASAGAALANKELPTGRDMLIGAGVGAALPAVGLAIGGVGRAIRNTEGGKARALWEKHGGNVGPLDSGSGIEEIAGIEPSRAGVGKASAIGARNIRRGLADDIEKNVSGPFRAAKQGVDYTPAGKEAVDVSSLIQTIGEAPAALRPALRRELQDLGATMTEDGRVVMTQSQLNEARQRLSNMANYGLNTGPGTANIKDASFKTIANAAKVLVDEGPYATANDIYERGMNMHAVDRSSIGLNTEPAKLKLGRAKEDARVAQLLRNLGNDSEAAGAMAERADIPGFVSRHPELERQVDLPNLIRAKDKLTFGLRGNATDNLIQVAKGHGIGGHALEAIRHNLAAATGRLAYGPAGLGLATEDAMTTDLNPIIKAYLAAQQRDQERAATLTK